MSSVGGAGADAGAAGAAGALSSIKAAIEPFTGNEPNDAVHGK